MTAKEFDSKAEKLHSEHLNLFGELTKIMTRIAELREDNPNQEIIEKLLQATPHRKELTELCLKKEKIWKRIEEIGIERRSIHKELMQTRHSELI